MAEEVQAEAEQVEASPSRLPEPVAEETPAEEPAPAEEPVAEEAPAEEPAPADEPAPRGLRPRIRPGGRARRRGA